MGTESGSLDDIFVANHAKWDGQTKTYHKEGSVETFADNLWRRYFKRYNPTEDPQKKNMPANEAIVFQKYEVNPIAGILINADRIALLTDKDKKATLDLLKENPQLKLYFYDSSLKEHTVRVVDNDPEVIKDLLDQKEIDVSQLPPFKGFDKNKTLQDVIKAENEKLAAREKQEEAPVAKKPGKI